MGEYDHRLLVIEKKLDEHGQILARIQETLGQIAVQGEQIIVLRRELSALWKKWDTLTDPNSGLLKKLEDRVVRNETSLQSLQRWFWVVLVPILIGGLAIVYELGVERWLVPGL